MKIGSRRRQSALIDPVIWRNAPTDLGGYAENGILRHALCLLILTFASFDLHAAKTVPLPNIVIIFTDDQGYADVGVFGAKGFSTPNLDRNLWDNFPIRGALEVALRQEHARINVRYLGDGQSAAFGEYAIRSRKLTWRRIPTSSLPTE